MRADRLLSILMILQIREWVTAKELSEELEVSVRTIYRDVTALCSAGVPIYTERGPGGGISLIESYRTDLTGLTKDEVRALFLINPPTALDELGLGHEFKAALLKLSAALSSSQRQDEERTRQRFYLDWNNSGDRFPKIHLQTIQEAVWEDICLKLMYLSSLGNWIDPLEAEVEPYGLVAKNGEWFLVCKHVDHIKVIQIQDIVEASKTGKEFSRPEDFDLINVWREWCLDYKKHRPTYKVKVRVSPGLIPHLQSVLGDAILQSDELSAPADEDGWITLTLLFEYLEQARSRLLGFGRAVEILEPHALRMSLKDYADQVVDFYKGLDRDS
ncbi:MAG: WYL domain-containing protein [Anaerolineales bacterium]|jgi:predicted DNA-binding transcriptional regulator YafY